MADEMGLHRETGLDRHGGTHRVLDLGQRLLEALLRRIAPVDDDLEQGRDLPTAGATVSADDAELRREWTAGVRRWRQCGLPASHEGF